jgi:hypothetical protein
MAGRSPGWLARALGEGENPLTWSVPTGVILGIAVRVHVAFLAYAAVRMLRSIPQDGAGPVFEAASLGVIVLLVLLHEAGRVMMCRLARGEFAEIVLWPLGGLTVGSHGGRWRSALLIASGGPLIHAALAPVFGGALWLLAGRHDLILVEPTAFASAERAALGEGLLVWLVFKLHAINLVLLVLNAAVPMPPLDAARALHALIWRRRGEFEADRVMAGIGIASGVLLALAGLLVESSAVVAAAVFGVLVSVREQRRSRALVRWLDDLGPGARPADDADGADDPVELDRVLAKITRSGLGSLSAEERRALDRASAARRGR